MSIAQEIRDEVWLVNMTQKEFAKRLGVSANHVSDILRGRRAISPRVAVRIERVMGMDAAHILCEQALEKLEKARGGKRE